MTNQKRLVQFFLFFLCRGYVPRPLIEVSSWMRVEHQHGGTISRQYWWHQATQCLPCSRRPLGAPDRSATWQHQGQCSKVLFIPLPDFLMFPGATHSWVPVYLKLHLQCLLLHAISSAIQLQLTTLEHLKSNLRCLVWCCSLWCSTLRWQYLEVLQTCWGGLLSSTAALERDVRAQVAAGCHWSEGMNLLQR